MTIYESPAQSMSPPELPPRPVLPEDPVPPPQSDIHSSVNNNHDTQAPLEVVAVQTYRQQDSQSQQEPQRFTWSDQQQAECGQENIATTSSVEVRTEQVLRVATKGERKQFSQVISYNQLRSSSTIVSSAGSGLANGKQKPRLRMGKLPRIAAVLAEADESECEDALSHDTQSRGGGEGGASRIRNHVRQIIQLSRSSAAALHTRSGRAVKRPAHRPGYQGAKRLAGGVTKAGKPAEATPVRRSARQRCSQRQQQVTQQEGRENSSISFAYGGKDNSMSTAYDGDTTLVASQSAPCQSNTAPAQSCPPQAAPPPPLTIEQVRCSLAPNGLPVHGLLKLQQSLLSMHTSSERRQGVIDLLVRTRDSCNISTTDVHFDLCTLDREVVLQIQAILGVSVL